MIRWYTWKRWGWITAYIPIPLRLAEWWQAGYFSWDGTGYE